MPIAIRRFSAADVELPLTVTLDDGDAMVAGRSLRNFPNFVARARLSLSGQAIPQAGDLHGLSEVDPEQTAVAVTIDAVWSG